MKQTNKPIETILLCDNVLPSFLSNYCDKLGHALHAERASHVIYSQFQIEICNKFAMKSRSQNITTYTTIP